MTPSQQRNVLFLCNFIDRQLHKRAEFGDTVTAFEAVEHEGFVSVWAKTDMEGLRPSSLLRCHSAQTWQFFVGKRGGVTVSMCPQSFHQFHGRRAFGMLFDVSEVKHRRKLAA